MDFIQNFVPFSIILSLAAGVISSAVSGKAARRLSVILISVVCIMSGCVLAYTIHIQSSFIYVMGRFPAPWGNELRAGMLEGLLACFFSIIMLLSIVGGLRTLSMEISEERTNLYFVMIDLMMASLLALVYTNDLFTAYVFVEINTMAACALIMVRNFGHTIVAATKYMIMSLLGSGLLLLGISMLYGITGHLLMSNLRVSIAYINTAQQYRVPLTVCSGLIVVGLAIKSSLYPFHSWLPDAYSYSTPSSSAILSSLVSKGYIFLCIKIIYRVFGTSVVVGHKETNVLFTLGVIGMIMGSLSAIRQHDIRRMIAYSSIAQIGYIYMGMGIGNIIGMKAAVFHIISHAASKSMLFIAAQGLSEVSEGRKDFTDLKGSGYRNVVAGVAFSVGAFSMVGIPLFAGFTSKVLFAQAALSSSDITMWIAMIALAISTILNAIYFLRAVISIYTPRNEHMIDKNYHPAVSMNGALVVFVILNVFLGTFSEPLKRIIEHGIAMFG